MTALRNATLHQCCVLEQVSITYIQYCRLLLSDITWYMQNTVFNAASPVVG
jgi:hypothetical protein